MKHLPIRRQVCIPQWCSWRKDLYRATTRICG